MTTRALCLMSSLLMFLVAGRLAGAQTIQVDTTFGTGGVYLVPDGGSVDDFCLDAAGNIYLVGSKVASDGFTAMTVWKLTPTGTPDTSFGTNGLVQYGNGVEVIGECIRVDASGNLFVMGRRNNSSNAFDVSVWKLLPTGNLDPTFAGGTGIFSSLPGVSGGHCAMALSATGTIYFGASVTYAGVSGTTDAGVWKLKPNGTLDATFADNGFWMGNFATGGDRRDFLDHMTVDAQDNVFFGNAYNTASSFDVYVAKLTPTGVPDAAFGSAGVFRYRTTGNEYGDEITLASDGSLFVSGNQQRSGGKRDLTVWKITTAGILDASFASGGVYCYDNPNGNSALTYSSGSGSLLDAKGKIYVVGWALNPAGKADAALWQFSAQGALENFFTHDGNGGDVRWARPQWTPEGNMVLRERGQSGWGIRKLTGFSASNNSSTGMYIASGPTLSSTTPVTGQSITFSVTAAGSTVSNLMYIWDFGDGSKSAAASPTHTYTVPGVYTVSVYVGDGKTSAHGELTVTVTGVDLSGGGGSGTDNSNNGDSGNPQVNTTLTLFVSTLQAKVCFNADGKDSLRLQGSLSLPGSLFPQGKVLTVNIGDVTASFPLDYRGKGKTESAAASLSGRRSGANLVGTVKLRLNLKNGSYASAWQAQGATVETVKDKVLSMPIRVSLTDLQDGVTTHSVSYSAKAGVGGRLKTTK